MRRLRLAAFLALPALLAGCAGLLLKKAAPADIQVPRTPERLARGEYLVTHVAACFDCHSPSKGGLHVPDMTEKGAGGVLFGKEDGLPGQIYATNITPDPATGLGKWTDGEILRAMREGVDKEGNALFPIMPYNNYRQLSEDDAQAIVAYLRTIPAIEHAVPARQLDFPLNIIVNLMPKPMDGPAPALPTEQIARGKYVFTAASCADCHTPQGSKGPDLTKLGAGGMVFHAGPTSYPAPNITPDQETGIGGWTDAQVAVSLSQGLRPDGKGLRPPMPWFAYQGMAKDDLKALVAYMKTLAPIKHDVGKRW
ncbi:MAG: c-type cytochrome [Cyanobacteria bacterium RYN_339]|nr:c-type cytochrome [Cyanobacteria bacterium RYN_339]